jgi:hypothetical protein
VKPKGIDRLIIYGFMSRSRIFHLYGDFTIASEGLQNLGLCLVLMAFEQGGIFIVPRLLYMGPRFFGLIRRTAPFGHLLWHARGCGGSILTRILMGETKGDDTCSIEFFSIFWSSSLSVPFSLSVLILAFQTCLSQSQYHIAAWLFMFDFKR